MKIARLTEYQRKELIALIEKGHGLELYESNREYVLLIEKYWSVLTPVLSWIDKTFKTETMTYHDYTDEIRQQYPEELRGLAKGLSDVTIRKRYTEFKKNEMPEKFWNVNLTNNTKAKLVEKFYSFSYLFKFIFLDGHFGRDFNHECLLFRWNVYFHRVFNENVHIKKHSGIGNVLLTYDRIGGQVRIENDTQNGGYNYEGSVTKSDEHVVSFSLERVTPGGKRDSSLTLDMKVFLNLDAQQEIALGAYVSYEKGLDVLCGTVVFERIAENWDAVTERQICPRHKRQDFLNTHESIRYYLSRKNLNRIKVKRGNNSYVDLQSFVKSSSGKRLNSSSFIPIERYSVFLSTPVGGVSNIKKKLEVITSIINAQEFAIYNDFLKFECPALRGTKKANAIKHDQILNKIKNASLFVLIYGELNLSSFSLIELGYAVAYCQRILLFCKRGAVPEQVRYFYKLENVTVFELDDVLVYDDYITHIEEELQYIFFDIHEA